MYFLLTDKCFLLVLLFVFMIFLSSLRREPTRAAYQKIARRPLAMAAGVILCFFLAVAVLDSIHIRYQANLAPSGKIMQLTGTVLDYLLYPIGAEYEKTYSAPMSLKLYTSESVMINGTMQRLHPKLRYTSGLKDEVAKKQFIQVALFKALLYTIVTLFVLYLSVYILRQWRSGAGHGARARSIRASFISFALCVFGCLALYFLSRKLHVLGTGKIGQDVLYYAIKSIRTGLIIGLLTTLIMLPLALLLGISAGYFGGLVDDVIQYLYTTLSSIPGVLLITASVLSMQTFIATHPQFFPSLESAADARLLALCLILGVTSWTSLCRLLRAEVLKLREVDYVQAAVALGSRALPIITRHLLPNVMHIVVITLVLDFSFLVLAEAVLSYVGVGVSPMTISWGNMINGARLELAREPLVWWPILAAFSFMFLLVLCGNLFADAVRDAFDPRHTSN